MRALAILALLSAAGCTSMPADPSHMTPEQIKEWSRDKSASINCVVARNATGTVVMASANLDKASIKGGTLTVKPASECEMTITADPAIVSVSN